jgi:hypothetical protein
MSRVAFNCTSCGAENTVVNMKPGDGVICAKCGKGQRVPEIAEPEVAKNPHDSSAHVAVTPITDKVRSKTPQGPQEEIATSGYEFKTLLGYGKFISGVGWIVIILGVIGILAGISTGDDKGWFITGGALLTGLTGLGLVVFGQLISCFVSIERNTRVTKEILQQKH